MQLVCNSIHAIFNDEYQLNQTNMDWEKSLTVELSTGEQEQDDLEALLEKQEDDVNLYL